MDMLNSFGETGLKISRLGFGAAQAGDENLSEKDAETLLNGVLDLGINLIDTARGYGASEERIGKYISKRRSEFVLSSKCGYDVEGYENWTYDCVLAGINQALSKLRTDVIDIMHLHSCPIETLKNNSVIEALERARDEGKVRYIAYSGENEELKWAIESDHFDSIQTSVNICDQRGISEYLPLTVEKNLGVIGKRPLANVFWLYDEQPHGKYCHEYWKRAKTMALEPPHGMDWEELAIRFSGWQKNVDTVITGSSKLKNIEANLRNLMKGPLDDATVSDIRARFKPHAHEWLGQI